MGIEVLIGLSLAATGFLGGYIFSIQRLMAKRDLEFAAKAETLNQNLANFSKAYEEISTGTLRVETRLASLEFRVNGGNTTMAAGPRPRL